MSKMFFKHIKTIINKLKSENVPKLDFHEIDFNYFALTLQVLETRHFCQSSKIFLYRLENI